MIEALLFIGLVSLLADPDGLPSPGHARVAFHIGRAIGLFALLLVGIAVL